MRCGDARRCHRDSRCKIGMERDERTRPAVLAKAEPQRRRCRSIEVQVITDTVFDNVQDHATRLQRYSAARSKVDVHQIDGVADRETADHAGRQCRTVNTKYATGPGECDIAIQQSAVGDLQRSALDRRRTGGSTGRDVLETAGEHGGIAGQCARNVCATAARNRHIKCRRAGQQVEDTTGQSNMSSGAAGRHIEYATSVNSRSRTARSRYHTAGQDIFDAA